MKIGVVGAGLMGAEIALVFALAGLDVQLHDRDAAALEKALARLAALLDRGVSRGLYTEGQRAMALDRIRPAPDLAGFGDRDLVTEAVFEALEVKSEVLAALDKACPPACVIASNTSTLPISTLSAALSPERRPRFLGTHYFSKACPPACVIASNTSTLPISTIGAALSPERRPRFLGTHYFSPVSRMQMVEVVPAFETSPEIVAWTTALLEGVGKKPIAVKDVPGFAVNRMLHAMLIEAVKLVEEGVATPEDLDTACRLGLGHPIGPFALMDNVTSGLCLQVQEILQESYGERFRPPALLKQRVAAGYSGGRGKPGWLEKA
ncbi:3-hydroxyacyl-CoA dehydrogenase family protein [Caulobacter sp. UNC358MFTsu5.1]|uniref:3-hydroxyacyl-CoA dehydrogenase family protein n=1 Tax=Caulobacter sp. UNC358MFTsu5.1 TaxID=1449049 RepID=UPI000AE7C0EE|nr:3-hydroxyacyl-CoA dehydrogenase family protein [Caulobacter sp. UNC358MFTsu5.1]